MAIPKIRSLEDHMLVVLTVEGQLNKANLFSRITNSTYYKLAPKEKEQQWAQQLERAYARLIETESIEEAAPLIQQHDLFTKILGSSHKLTRITEKGRKRFSSINLSDKYSLDRLITPIGLELSLGLILQKAGFKKVHVVGQSGDGGVDVTAEIDDLIWGGRYLIQCKRWQGRLPPNQVREFYGRICADNVTKGILICTGGFTKEAYNFADPLKYRLTLMNGEDWRNLARKYL